MFIILISAGCNESRNQTSTATKTKLLQLLYYGDNKNITSALENDNFIIIQNGETSTSEAIQIVLIENDKAESINKDILMAYLNSGAVIYYLDLKSTEFLQKTFFNNNSYETAVLGDKNHSLYRITIDSNKKLNLLTIGWQTEISNYYESIADKLRKYYQR